MLIPAHLVNHHFDDRYFDVVNALDEAQQVFFVNSNLQERIANRAAARESFVIGETGFGAGRILVALLEFMRQSGLSDVRIEYNSVELYPLSPERMLGILAGFRDRVSAEIDLVTEAYRSLDVTAAGWQSATIRHASGLVQLNLWLGEALEMVEALDKPCDAWFLDGHGPKKNPSIWRPELLMAVGTKTRPGGTCATYTVASTVRNALTAAGFSVERLPGCGGKKHVLQGRK